MFNQTENMIARADYQQVQRAGSEFVEGVEVASEPGLVRRLLSAFTQQKQRNTEKAPAQPAFERRALKTKHG